MLTHRPPYAVVFHRPLQAAFIRHNKRNNAAERTLGAIARGRKPWLFAGSDRGGQRAAAMYGPIVTAKLAA